MISVEKGRYDLQHPLNSTSKAKICKDVNIYINKYLLIGGDQTTRSDRCPRKRY